MSRLSDRCKRIASLALERYGDDCVLEDKNGNLIRFRAIRRAPQASEIDNATILIVPFIISDRELAYLKVAIGYDDALFYGETIISDGDRYKIDWKTPYIADDGPSSTVRIITTKVA